MIKIKENKNSKFYYIDNELNNEKINLDDYIQKRFHVIEKFNNLRKQTLKLLKLKYTGVYILKNISNSIIYIGSSRYLLNEIRNSIIKHENKNNDKIEIIDVYITENYKYSEFLEYYLINKYNPHGNVTKIKLKTLIHRNKL